MYRVIDSKFSYLLPKLFLSTNLTVDVELTRSSTGTRTHDLNFVENDKITLAGSLKTFVKLINIINN